MLQQTLLAIIILAVCVALFAVKSLFGRGSFRIGHACRMNVQKRRQKQSDKTFNQ